ncbi:BRO family protein [Kosakonia sacchari]|uniref:BRO-N domain-containing protein n=1 Tax=Kosakonia sacchari TaxID=1158459 RepID=UPI0030BACFE4
MKIVAKSDLNFHGTSLQPVADANGIWLTSADVAKALGYKSTKSISNLFSQYEDEFSHGMTMVIESVTNGIHGSTRRMKVRVFSLRGAHLIAMFARTPVAKEFRRWVLDILDREIAINTPAYRQVSDREMHAHNVNAMFDYFAVMHEVWSCQIEPALRAIESPLAARLHDRFSDGAAFMKLIKDQAESQLLPGEEARIR